MPFIRVTRMFSCYKCQILIHKALSFIIDSSTKIIGNETTLCYSISLQCPLYEKQNTQILKHTFHLNNTDT